MNTAYTPGPWIDVPYSSEIEIQEADCDGFRRAIVIAHLKRSQDKEIDTRILADARLIASAPALLEALHLLTESAAELERQAVIVCSRTGAKESCLSNAATVAQLGIERARLAIAQATGGEK